MAAGTAAVIAVDTAPITVGVVATAATDSFATAV